GSARGVFPWCAPTVSSLAGVREPSSALAIAWRSLSTPEAPLPCCARDAGRPSSSVGLRGRGRGSGRSVRAISRRLVGGLVRRLLGRLVGRLFRFSCLLARL